MKGALRLQSLIVILALVVAANPVNAEELRQTEDAKAIIDKSLKALGGVEKISKLHAVCVKGTCTLQGIEKVSFEGSFAAFDKAKVEIAPCDFTHNKKLIGVVSGDKFWTRRGAEETQDIDTLMLVQMRELLHAFCLPDLLITLKANGYTLATIGEAKIDGHEAIGMRVTHKEHKDVRLFFDKTTALPIKSEVKFQTERDGTQMEIMVEITYSKYKEFAGVKHFTRIKMEFVDFESEANLEEVDLREKLDPAVFEKP